MAYKADVAQLAEQLIRNQQVSGSTPLVGSMNIKGFPRISRAYLVKPFFVFSCF